jgi:hypothetical protein
MQSSPATFMGAIVVENIGLKRGGGLKKKVIMGHKSRLFPYILKVCGDSSTPPPPPNRHDNRNIVLPDQ